jgi:hypothetical protein
VRSDLDPERAGRKVGLDHRRDGVALALGHPRRITYRTNGQ